MWCVSADLNNFRAVNDARGYECGDRLLRVTEELLTRTLDGAFEIFRLGRDEFIMLSCGVSAEKAPALLETFYPAVEAHNAGSGLQAGITAG